MKVGAYLPQFEGWMAGETPRWNDIREMAVIAEESGLDSLWLADHLWLENFPPFDVLVPDEEPHGAWESWSLLAALAASTSRIELGTLVTSMRFRNPAVLAKMVDVVDEVSDGRLIVGLGAGGPNLEYRTFGLPTDKHYSRFAESLELFHGLIRQGRMSYSGQFYTAEDCVLRPRGPRPDGPPILIGCRGDRMLDLTARFADTWHMSWINDVAELPDWHRKVDAACERVGREPATLERSVSVMVDVPGADQSPEADWVAAWRQTKKPISGSREAIAEALIRFADSDIGHVQAWLSPNTPAGFEEFGRIKLIVDQMRP